MTKPRYNVLLREHRVEELARPWPKRIIGDDLYPCVGVDDMYSASFDGLTLLEDTVWEHKQLNDTIRAAMTDGSTGQDLPLHYQIQMEHQSMVSGAQRVLFMASAWNGEQLMKNVIAGTLPTPNYVPASSTDGNNCKRTLPPTSLSHHHRLRPWGVHQSNYRHCILQSQEQ